MLKIHEASKSQLYACEQAEGEKQHKAEVKKSNKGTVKTHKIEKGWYSKKKRWLRPFLKKKKADGSKVYDVLLQQANTQQ